MRMHTAKVRTGVVSRMYGLKSVLFVLSAARDQSSATHPSDSLAYLGRTQASELLQFLSAACLVQGRVAERSLDAVVSTPTVRLKLRATVAS